MRVLSRRARARIVPDTNVLVSALFWEGPESEVMYLAEAGHLQGYTSMAIMSELYDVLTGNKFQFTHNEADFAVTYYALILKIVVPRKKIRLVLQDPDDGRVLECAVEARAHYIITGDRHLLALGKFGSSVILRASQFVKPI